MALVGREQVGLLHFALDAEFSNAHAPGGNAHKIARGRCLHCPFAPAQNGARTRGDSPMIDLFYWPTPNGHKITMFLEETAMPYTLVPVNIGKGEQFKADFLAISPNNRMPAIIDHSP